jgi:hypothetical protein
MGLYAEHLTATTTNPSGVPDALRERPRWLGTRFEPRKGKPGKLDKPPYRVRRGMRIIKASKTNPESWATFEEAASALQEGRVDAIGYVVMADDPFYVVDCDGAIDTATGEINATAAEIIHAHNTYSERSCSGHGLHLIGEGEKPAYAGCKSSEDGFGVEVYDAARFVVLTGDRLAGTPADTQPRQRELCELCRRLWPKQEKMAKGPRQSSPVGLEDEELLERARRARSTGKKFRKLYDHGDTSGYKSASEADYGLLNLLIFWCAGDADRIVRLFESSALYRAKAKHRRYVVDSTRNALASYVGKFYRPRRVRAEEDADPLAPYLELLLSPAAWTGRKAASAYKCFCACVIEAVENGIVDDEGNLCIRCDTRTIAETAGTRQATVCQSGLPYLMQTLRVLRWHRSRGGGRQSGTLVLMRAAVKNVLKRINQISTLLIDTLSDTPKHTLEALRLLIRMRSGSPRTADLMRLGMVPMFVAVALLAAPLRGQSVRELRTRTGRRRADLMEALGKLKAAGVVRELKRDVFRLTDDFRAAYERHLEQSGITYAEREQRRRHAEDRARRDRGIRVDERDRKLRGKRHMNQVIRESARRERKKTPPHERTLSVEEVAFEIRQERSGPYLALLTYLRKRTDERLEWLTNAVLRVRGRDPDKHRDRHLRVVRQAARDPANHPGECPCRGCA